jgi:hypothetical protein
MNGGSDPHALPEAGTLTTSGERRTYELKILDYQERAAAGASGYREVVAHTTRGELDLRHYVARGGQAGVVWLGGVGGGWDTPARDLYPRLCRALAEREISSVRVKFRHSTSLPEAVLDALTALHLLEKAGVERLAIVGHSFGGAVAIQAAVHQPRVRTLVTLATQSFGASAASALGPERSLLLVHGTNDTILPAFCSEMVHRIATAERRLVLLDGAGHSLDEAADEVAEIVDAHLLAALGAAS